MSRDKGERIGLHVRLPFALWRDLKYRAADRRTSMGDEVVEALKRYLEEGRPEEEGRRKRGVEEARP